MCFVYLAYCYKLGFKLFFKDVACLIWFNITTWIMFSQGDDWCIILLIVAEGDYLNTFYMA